MKRMVMDEVLRNQNPAQPLFKAPDTQAATHHASRFPYRRLDEVNLRPLIEGHRGAFLLPIDGTGLLHLLPIKASGCGVDAAVNTHPAIRDLTQ